MNPTDQAFHKNFLDWELHAFNFEGKELRWPSVFRDNYPNKEFSNSKMPCLTSTMTCKPIFNKDHG